MASKALPMPRRASSDHSASVGAAPLTKSQLKVEREFRRKFFRYLVP
jgi:hypothetical protein